MRKASIIQVRELAQEVQAGVQEKMGLIGKYKTERCVIIVVVVVILTGLFSFAFYKYKENH